MDIFEKAREAEETKGKARDAYKKAEEALMATPEYKDYEKADKAYWEAKKEYEGTTNKYLV